MGAIGTMGTMGAEVAVVQRKAGELPALQMEPAAFIKEFAPLPAMRRCGGINTPVKAAKDKELPTLGSIKKTYGEKFMLGFIKLWIMDLIEYLGGKELTDVQLEETALRIFANNYYLNIADLNIVLNRVKDGDVAIATPINGAKLNHLFTDYRDERMQAVVDSQINEHEVLKKYGYIPQVNDIAQATLDAMIENQMKAAEKEAKVEQAEIDRKYREWERAKKVWEKYPALKRIEERGERKEERGER